MVLILSHEEVCELLTMDDAIGAMEAAYLALGRGEGVERPRNHTYVTIEEPHLRYLFKSMDGIVPSLGICALRITSEINPFKREAGFLRTFKVPLRQEDVRGDFWLGLVFLFDIHTGALLAIVPDGEIGKIRMGASTAIAAKYLAPAGAEGVAMIGSSWQAEGQLEGLKAVLPISRAKVYSPNRDHRRAFAERMGEKLDLEITPVENAEEAIRGMDIFVTATNAYEPVFKGEWLTEGVHLTSILHREVDEACGTRPDLVVLNHKLKMMDYFPAGQTYCHWEAEKMERWPELAELVAGKVSGRGDRKQVTHFLNNGGLAGAQFGAVGYAVLQKAKAKGVGREVPLAWFLEPVHN